MFVEAGDVHVVVHAAAVAGEGDEEPRLFDARDADPDAEMVVGGGHEDEGGVGLVGGPVEVGVPRERAADGRAHRLVDARRLHLVEHFGFELLASGLAHGGVLRAVVLGGLAAGR
jgi:hypothetical protein